MRELYMVLARERNDSLLGNAAFTTRRLHNGQKDSPLIGITDRDIPDGGQRLLHEYQYRTCGFLRAI
jgi:hypothetical protein